MVRVFFIIIMMIYVSCSSSSNLAPKMEDKARGTKLAEKNTSTTRTIPEEKIREIKPEPASKETVVSEREKSLFTNYEDKFLKKIKSVKDEIITITLKAKKKPEYEYKEIWSAQIASFSIYEKATELKNEISGKYSLPVYIQNVSSNFKVLVGNKKSRTALNQLLGELKYYGYESAWAVKHQIKSLKEKKSGLELAKPYISLQVGTYSSEINAEKTKSEIQARIKSPVYIVYESGLYKVMVEKKKTRGELQLIQKKLKELGYKSWFKAFN